MKPTVYIDDPAIQTVRVARLQISKYVDHDPVKLVEYYQQRQKKHLGRLVNRQLGELEAQDKNAG